MKTLLSITLVALHGVMGGSLLTNSNKAKMAERETILYSSSSNDLPPVSTWDHDPLFLQADSSVVILSNQKQSEGKHKKQQSCPIGIPFEFESDLFKGQALIRIRNLENSHDVTSDKEYFRGRKRKNQVIIQGKFKEEIEYTDVITGSEYKNGFSTQPPVIFQKLLGKVLRRVSPSTDIKLCGDKPKVLMNIGEGAQTISVNNDGEQPDIRSVVNMQEKGFADSSKERKGFFSSLHRRSHNISSEPMVYDTQKVYTFETYDDQMDYINYRMELTSFIKLDMVNKLDRQPFQVMARTKTDGRYLWLFTMYHSRHYNN